MSCRADKYERVSGDVLVDVSNKLLYADISKCCKRLKDQLYLNL